MRQGGSALAPGIELHFEWQGRRLALMPGPPLHPEQANEAVLHSDEATIAFQHGVRLLQVDGTLVVAPMDDNVDTDEDELEDEPGTTSSELEVLTEDEDAADLGLLVMGSDDEEDDEEDEDFVP